MKQIMRSYFLKMCLMLSVLGFGTAPLSAEPETEWTLERATRLSDELVDAFNVQIKSELDGAHFYLALSNLFYLKSLDGFGHWFGQQYYEELNHARMMMDYLKRKNARVVLTSIDAPEKLTAEEPIAVFEQSLKLEETQTSRIHELHTKALALKSNDAATFLQWFIDEQVQEEDHFQNVVDRLTLVQNSLEGVLLIDKDLAARLAAVVWSPGQPMPPH